MLLIASTKAQDGDISSTLQQRQPARTDHCQHSGCQHSWWWLYAHLAVWFGFPVEIKTEIFSSQASCLWKLWDHEAVFKSTYAIKIIASFETTSQPNHPFRWLRPLSLGEGGPIAFFPQVLNLDPLRVKLRVSFSVPRPLCILPIGSEHCFKSGYWFWPTVVLPWLSGWHVCHVPPVLRVWFFASALCV